MKTHSIAFSLLVSAALVVVPSRSDAQRPEVPGRAGVADALRYLLESETETLADQVALCEIPAPPFGEAARAEAYRDRFAAQGLNDVRIDGEGNVLGEIGTGDPVVVLSAHLDSWHAASGATDRREMISNGVA